MQSSNTNSVHEKDKELSTKLLKFLRNMLSITLYGEKSSSSVEYAMTDSSFLALRQGLSSP